MLFLLKVKGRTTWDSYDSKVVRAASSVGARKLANISTGDEGSIWTDVGLVSCNELDQNGASEVILESFNAG